MSTNPIAAEGHFRDGNQRCFARQRIETLTYVGLGPGNGGVVFDVSEGGMAFQGIQRLQRDELLCINFKLPGISVSMESITEVAWLNKSGKGGGLRFIDVPDDTLSNIKEWFSLRTMPRGLPEKTAISCAPVTAKNLEPFPAIHSVAIPENDLDATPASLSDPVRDSSLISVAAISAVEAGVSTAANIGSLGVAETPVLRDLFLDAKTSGTAIAPFARTLLVFFAIMAVLGAILFLFDGKAEHLSTIEPQALGDVSYETPIPVSVPSAPPAEDSPKEPAAPKATALAVVPAKAAASPKINPFKTSRNSERLADTTMAAMPRPTMVPRTVDSSIPSVTPPLGPEPAQRLPAMLPGMPSSMLSVREPGVHGSKLDPAQLISRKDPVYPAGAKAAGISGRVELHFTIGADGHVRNVTVVTGNGLLARAAVEALQSWHYNPARLGGTPVQSEASTDFVFQRK